MSEWTWPDEPAGLERASSKWWLFLVLGAVSAILGIVLLFDLFTAVRTLALLAAVGLIVTGMGELVTTGRYQSSLGMVAGVILIIGGVLAAAWPGITLLVLAVVTGIGLLISGAARLVGAFALQVEGSGWLVAGGIISVIVGVLALVWPGVTLLALGTSARPQDVDLRAGRDRVLHDPSRGAPSHLTVVPASR